ncbi:hypothetical protein OUZ56_011749 [Daphnia magna]|uniref:Uncharacterized protein n=1 Tax=Daphnia magna TaxID=35525 RepID=A0ABQ9Z142_9CRUS|nr:hypothetical protein OUZ56_011749 [Daphnia magna]
MNEAVAKAESIESGGNISLEDEMKPEEPHPPGQQSQAETWEKKGGPHEVNKSAQKSSGRSQDGGHQTQEVANVKDLHHKYMESLPDITDQQRRACEKWKVQFDTDHVEILNFAIRYATSSRHSVSSVGTSASDVTISTTLSQNRSTGSAPTDLPRQTSQLDLHIQKQMLELEVKLEQSKIQMEANATSVTETLSKALKGISEQLGKLIDSSHVTSTEITANTQLVKDSRKTLHDMDQKIETVKLDLNALIEGLRTEIGVSKVHLRTIQEQAIHQGARIPSRPQTLQLDKNFSPVRNPNTRT